LPARDDEAWLRNLLDTCQRALNDLRKAKTAEAEARLIDLEQTIEKVERRLNSLPLHGRVAKTA